MHFFGGIDIGSSTAKLAIVDTSGRIVAKAMKRSGIDYGKTAQELLTTVSDESGLSRDAIMNIISTGYGRDNVVWSNGTKTEIACHARGAFFHFKTRMTVIDIGAQDSKVIHLDDQGKRINFKMNRKCAAGTGAFIEEVAHKLALDVSELNALAEKSTKEVTLGSFCTVFAATEVIEKIRAGAAVEDIVRGAFSSVTKRIVEMGHVDGILVATGGVVAHNPFLAKMIGNAFSTEAYVAPDAQYMGAFGAALYAADLNLNLTPA
jgi:predicted CoA-substrate-specific enzyme activase